MKKLLAILLTCCTLFAMCSISAAAEEANPPELPKWELGSYYTDADNNSLAAHDTAPFNLVQYYCGGNSGWNDRGLTVGEVDMVKGEEQGEGQTNEESAFDNGPWYYHAYYLNGSNQPMVSSAGRFAYVTDQAEQRFDVMFMLDLGVSFTAPESGAVKFKYKFDKQTDTDNVVLVIGKADKMSCSAQGVWSDYESVVNTDGEGEISINVTEGQKVYFLVHSQASDWSDTGRIVFYFDTVEYTTLGVQEEENTGNNNNNNTGGDNTNNGNGSGTTNNTGNQNNNNEETTEAPANNDTAAASDTASSDTAASAEEEKSGCGATVMGMSAVIACVGAVAFTARKRRKED